MVRVVPTPAPRAAQGVVACGGEDVKGGGVAKNRGVLQRRAAEEVGLWRGATG